MQNVLNAIVYSYATLQPFDVTFPGPVTSLREVCRSELGGTVSALAFLAVTNSGYPVFSAYGRTQIAQLWDNDGRLGLLMYAPQPDFTYRYVWGTANLSSSSAALAFLPVEMGDGGGTRIVQLWDHNGRLGINVFAPQNDGSYAALWSSGDMGQPSGALRFVPVTMNGDGWTQIVQLWDNGGRLGMIVYAPQPDGSYAASWSTGDVGQGSAATAFLPATINDDRKTQIVQLLDNNGYLESVIYSPQADGSYDLLKRSTYTIPEHAGTLAYLPVYMSSYFAAYTRIVQLIDGGSGNLEYEVYSTDPHHPEAGFFDGPVQTLANGGLPALAFLPTEDPLRLQTNIAHFFVDGGRLGYHYYVPAKSTAQAPDNDQYQQTASGTLDAPASALAFLSVPTYEGGASQIVQLVVEPKPAPTVATVPDVFGAVSTLALKAVEGAGLVAQFTGDNRQGAWVFSQSPVAGKTVALGSTVTMVLKTGPQP